MKNNYFGKLNDLLKKDVAAAVKRENTAFDRISKPFNNSLVLFGAGKVGRMSAESLKKIGIKPLAFVDNDCKKWGSYIRGIKVISPTDAARRFRTKAAFIITIWSLHSSTTAIVKQLKRLQCKRVIQFPALAWKYPRYFLPYYHLTLPSDILKEAADIKKASVFFKEAHSRKEFIGHLKLLISPILSHSYPATSQKDEYFPFDIITRTDSEIFIDCGAFYGDTVRNFLQKNKKFKKIICFEPDPESFKKLKRFIKSMKKDKDLIKIYKTAVGKNTGKVRFDAYGNDASTINDKGATRVDCVPLDSVLSECKPTYIKMDIEGAELDVLKGARKTIKKYTPILAICVYHKPSDLWQITSYIKSLYQGYSFFLRRYNEIGWGLVCYAVPPSRLRAKKAHDHH